MSNRSNTAPWGSAPLNGAGAHQVLLIKVLRSASAIVAPLWLLAGLCACSSTRTVQQAPTAPPASSGAPRYASLYYWAAHPQKPWSPADSVPKALRGQAKDTGVDVFWVHPTIYTDAAAVDSTRLNQPAERLRWNADLNNSKMNAKVDNSTILNQASAFRVRLKTPQTRLSDFLTTSLLFVNERVIKSE
jgi:hypothetical protein